MRIIGLTGSMAMGKSTAARMFQELAVPVFDSDAAVHEFYRQDGPKVLAPHFPDAVVDGIVNRQVLSKYVVENSDNLKLLENIVHPVIGKKRSNFLSKQKETGSRRVVVDIPLLFEIGWETSVDIILVVTASKTTQKTRALLRTDMTVEKFEKIIANQIPDSEKRARAHYVISSEFGFNYTRSQIHALLHAID